MIESYKYVLLIGDKRLLVDSEDSDMHLDWVDGFTIDQLIEQFPGSRLLSIDEKIQSYCIIRLSLDPFGRLHE